jgi:hypothetical protein
MKIKQPNIHPNKKGKKIRQKMIPSGVVIA